MPIVQRPPTSNAHVEPARDGLTIVLTPIGPARWWQDWLVSLTLAGGLTTFASLAVVQLTRAEGWVDWLTWLTGLGLCLLVLRPVCLLVSQRLLERSLSRGTFVVEGRRLYLHRRVLFRGNERVWDEGSIVALDEEEGGLCILQPGLLETFFQGRDVEELRWLASLLRDALEVPADPPRLEGEIAVGYRLPAWPRERRGFVHVLPGEIRLRPRFVLALGLVIRPAGAVRENWTGVLLDSLGAGSLAVQPEDVRWGIAEGGDQVLRIWLHEQEAGEPVPLEIITEEVEPLRRGLVRFWEGTKE